MTKEELEKELEEIKDFKVYVFEWDIYVKAEDFRKKAIECRRLREDNRFLTKISKEYMVKENIVQVTEFTELYKDELEEENKNLKEKLEQIKEAYIRFEKVDSEFQKWLWELDQLIMNR